MSYPGEQAGELLFGNGNDEVLQALPFHGELLVSPAGLQREQHGGFFGYGPYNKIIM
ncbi:hypothetical protein [Paenibacillus sp. FSL R7-0333]|uniref:hypothetical protein n=1 Tax=Paenibacillus sp. FSL R7-0333 TaxID=1926587 RepID=UPI0030F9CBAA